MAKNNLLDTSTVTFSEIVSNGKKYQVPIYQRDYSWREENWEDLWTDILAVLSKETQNHYMGSIVLQRQEDKKFAIIDGQQRIATLSIIALATLKNIQDLIDQGVETSNNEERKKLLMDSFLGVKDAVSLKYSSKLFLNTNNNDFYQAYLLQLKDPHNKSSLNDSEKLLLKAFNFFYEKIKEEFSSSSGENLAGFLKDEVSEKLMFIQIVVENEVNAYTVFETLNARGESLTVTDLLKNYLFSLIPSQSQSDLEAAQRQWSKITELIGLDSFPQFLRHYWNSRNNLIRQEGLFKAVKKLITNAAKVFELLDDLEKTSEVYMALSDSNSDFWDSFTNKDKVCERVDELVLFNAKQCYPLLIAAYEKLSKDEFAKVLKICSIISFRRTVISEKNPNQLERSYNRVAQKVFQKNIKNVQGIFQDLQEVYLSDSEFEKDFAVKEIKSSGRTKKLLQYILKKLEEHISPRSLDWGKKVTVEHILPENPSPEWMLLFDEKSIRKLVNRIGNQTVLEKTLNKECGNIIFEQKKEIYQESIYELTKELFIYSSWNQKVINDRQRNLAKKATSIWRLDFE